MGNEEKRKEENKREELHRNYAKRPIHLKAPYSHSSRGLQKPYSEQQDAKDGHP